MAKTVIQVEQVGKLYRLGQVGAGTLAQDMSRMIARMRGQEDPTLKLGETNDRTAKSNSDYAWALRDVSFEVKEGEVLGIVGRNGAGKSTLLKLLSRVTLPTEGNIRMRGRMASLLEVGTGFHPELTGRENVFLNGAIMGMRKYEIKKLFDEIVDFAGVERYIDTPVKRYSSGMYVRLAFAVAAHLSPEIMIIDEVLAVGDAEFQRKCLGKMEDAAGNGRTVLFVSHNMAAVRRLCQRSLLLEKGGLRMEGPTGDVVNEYLRGGAATGTFGIIPDAYPRNSYNKDCIRLTSIHAYNQEAASTTVFKYHEALKLVIDADVLKPCDDVVLNISLMNDNDERLSLTSTMDRQENQKISVQPGRIRFEAILEQRLLPGIYTVCVDIMNDKGYAYDSVQGFGQVSVESFGEHGEKYPWARPIGWVNIPATINVQML